MNWQEHIAQAELLLKEADQELAMPGTPDQTAVIAVHVEMAKAHTMLAEAKRVRS